MTGPNLPLDEASWNVATSLPLLYSLVAGEELADMADERSDILVLTADLATSNRTDEFERRHPDRFFNVGIAEQNMVSMAAGLAASGLRPYVATYAAFVALLCAEQVRTDLAYTAMPVRILAHHAGVSLGFYGTSHHAIEDLAVMRAIPGLDVTAPCDAASTRAVLRATVDHPGPVYVRLGRGREQPIYDGPPAVERGRFVKLRDGDDLTIVATGVGVRSALQAADVLAEEDGVEARVLDAVYVKPLDVEAVTLAAEETGHVLSVEEHNVIGGLGGAVAEVATERGLPGRFARLGFDDEYPVVAPPTHLYRQYGLSPEGVVERARDLLGR